MTVKQGLAGVICYKCDLRCGAFRQLNYIFENSSRRLAIQRFQFKAMPVDMHRDEYYRSGYKELDGIAFPG